MNEIILRPARKEDCQEIRKLMQELAEYEKTPDAIKIGAETLENDGFGDKPLFYGFVAEENGKLLGYTVCYFIYPTWVGKSMHMSDLYVTEAARNRGVGSLLFNAVVKKALEENCKRLDFTVVSWNSAKEFYKSKGAIDITEAEDWHVFRMNEESLKKLAEKFKNP